MNAVTETKAQNPKWLDLLREPLPANAGMWIMSYRSSLAAMTTATTCNPRIIDATPPRRRAT